MSIPELRYRMLGRSGLRVSSICLGTMSCGSQWGFGADPATSHAILDAYAERGGNFLDTANKYHGGETEQILGDWLRATPGRRERTVPRAATGLIPRADARLGPPVALSLGARSAPGTASASLLPTDGPRRTSAREIKPVTAQATKYTLSMDHQDPNASGNHRKNLHRAIDRGGRDWC